ncbi:MAG: hypothetical protein WA021_03895 [Minisyncoccia bacterium]
MSVSSLQNKQILFLGAVILVFGAIVFAGEDRAPLSSSETRFVERSAGGLQIVPASCASDPHYTGDCSDGTEEGEPGSCTLSASPSSITSGQSSTLSWSTWRNDNYWQDSITLSSFGEVGETGSIVVSPTQTTTYDLEVSFSYFGITDGGTIHCYATVFVDEGQNPPSTPLPPNIPPGADGCPTGYSLQITTCVYTGCPAGYTLQGTACVSDSVPQCSGYVCVGNDLYERYEGNNQCLTRINQACAWGCSAGGCLAAPAGQGNITVTPAIVRSAESATVSWTTTDMVPNSCTVVENNPDITESGSGANGSFVAENIRQQTSFTLTCERLDGTTFTDSATVNILPVFEEN